MQILRGIGAQYSNLFDGGNSENGTDDTNFHTKWGWIATINAMANNDRTKWDFFFDMNVIEFLNTVAFFKDHNEMQIAEMKKHND